MIVKKTILRLLGSSDDKEKIGVARPEGPPLRGFRQGIGASDGSRKNRRHCTLAQKGIEAKSAYRHRLNRRYKIGHRCIGRPLYQRRCQAPRRSFFSTGSTDGASEHTIGALAVLCTRDDVKCPEEVSSAPVQPMGHRCIPPV